MCSSGWLRFGHHQLYQRHMDFLHHSLMVATWVKLLIDPRNQLAWPDAKPLDDYLFHQYMRYAREFHLCVQVHTGHMGGIRNRVDKANAAHLASVLELHSEVKFDLFHGNWPYMGDLLFLGKNYPNVSLNLCWVYTVDPIYAKELLTHLTQPVKLD